MPMEPLQGDPTLEEQPKLTELCLPEEAAEEEGFTGSRARGGREEEKGERERIGSIEGERNAKTEIVIVMMMMMMLKMLQTGR